MRLLSGGLLDHGLELGGGVGVEPARKGQRRAWVPARQAYAEVPVYERSALAIGETIVGPAIVEEPSSTLIVPPDARAVSDAAGNIVVTLR